MIDEGTKVRLLTLHNDARKSVVEGKLMGQPMAISMKPLVRTSPFVFSQLNFLNVIIALRLFSMYSDDIFNKILRIVWCELFESLT